MLYERALRHMSAYSMKQVALLQCVKLCTKLVMSSTEEQKWFEAEWEGVYTEYVATIGLQWSLIVI